MRKRKRYPLNLKKQCIPALIMCFWLCIILGILSYFEQLKDNKGHFGFYMLTIFLSWLNAVTIATFLNIVSLSLLDIFICNDNN